MISLHKRLKTETQPYHDNLEASLDLLRSDLTLLEYIDLLKKIYGYYSPLEAHLEIADSRKKVPSLIKDLDYFGVKFCELPVCKTLPILKTPSQKIGISYVLEGSTLGGAVLTEKFKEKFNLSPLYGLSFFFGHGKDTLRMWRDFLEELQIYSESRMCQPDEVVSSAISTFVSLGEWLNSPK